jgi:hypothetical protein
MEEITLENQRLKISEGIIRTQGVSNIVIERRPKVSHPTIVRKTMEITHIIDLRNL